MTIEELNIPGVFVITPKRFVDDRGWFSETYSYSALKAHGIDLSFVQDNHSLSLRKGTLRGFHFQTPPHTQAKLVRCIRGRILDVVVDVRGDSPNFGHFASAELSPQDGRQIFVPIGFAHAFMTLEPDTEIVYKVSDVYSQQCDGGIRWDDPTVAFPWEMSEGPFLSPKDEKLPFLRDFASPFTM